MTNILHMAKAIKIYFAGRYFTVCIDKSNSVVYREHIQTFEPGSRV